MQRKYEKLSYQYHASVFPSSYVKFHAFDVRTSRVTTPTPTYSFPTSPLFPPARFFEKKKEKKKFWTTRVSGRQSFVSGQRQKVASSNNEQNGHGVAFIRFRCATTCNSRNDRDSVCTCGFLGCSRGWFSAGWKYVRTSAWRNAPLPDAVLSLFNPDIFNDTSAIALNGLKEPFWIWNIRTMICLLLTRRERKSGIYFSFFFFLLRIRWVMYKTGINGIFCHCEMVLEWIDQVKSGWMMRKRIVIVPLSSIQYMVNIENWSMVAFTILMNTNWM